VKARPRRVSGQKPSGAKPSAERAPATNRQASG
jgi:hypothetical protein